MNREQFLSQLGQSLGSMPDAEKQEILYDYEEHFRNGLEEGKSEEQIAESLGNPRAIGNSYRIDSMLSTPEAGGNVTPASVSRAVFASISLTAFNLLFVIGPFIGLLAILVSFWAAVVAIAFAGLGCLVSPIFGDATQFVANPVLNAVFAIF